MDIQTFSSEYSDLAESRKIAGLQKLFNIILDDIDTFDALIEGILELATEEEANDGFGTEGANI